MNVLERDELPCHLQLILLARRHLRYPSKVYATAFTSDLSSAHTRMSLSGTAPISTHVTPSQPTLNRRLYRLSLVPPHIVMESYLQTHVVLYLCLRVWAQVEEARIKPHVGIYIMRLIGMKEMGSGRRRAEGGGRRYTS
jgi:hypothetical protein